MFDLSIQRVLLITIISLFIAAPRTTAVVLAEAGEPVRARDHTIDIPATIDVLKREKINTYLYQIWRTKTDWNQLGDFAAAAEKEGIDVWVYLVPWSETPDKSPNFAYPKPYETDYIAWADAIGAISQAHSNITAWVIDDFYVNATEPGRFTDDYVDRMLAAGKARNPNLKFYPVVYFQQPWADFVNRFATKIDGVIACYPRSQREVDDAVDYLRDRPHGPSLGVTFTRKKKVLPGAEALVVGQVDPRSIPRDAHLQFYFDDQTVGAAETGAHIAFTRVNGIEVWHQRVGPGGDKFDTAVDIPIAKEIDDALRNRRMLRIEAGVQTSVIESDAYVQARLDDLQITDANGEMVTPAGTSWRMQADPATHAELAPSGAGRGEFNVPMVLLLAGLPQEHLKRYDEAGTPENIERKLHFAADEVNMGKAVGIISWYTPKSNPGIIAKVADTFGALTRTDARIEP